MADLGLKDKVAIITGEHVDSVVQWHKDWQKRRRKSL